MFEAKVIIPDRPDIDLQAILVAIQNAMDGTALDIQVDFAVTVQTWAEQPGFKIAKPSDYVRTISTENEIYSFVNNGTSPHEILPVRAQALRFLTGGSAKTRPGHIGSNTGTEGTELVFASRVHHPGIAARQFDEAIADKWQDEFPVVMQRAIDAAVT